MGKPKKFIVGGLLNLGYGLATAGASYAQERKALRQMAQLDQIEGGNIMSLAARRRVARQESDAQAATDEAQRSQATALEAGREAGGARAVQAMTPGTIRATEEATARAIDRFGESGARSAQMESADLVQSRQAMLADQRSDYQRAADAARANMVQGLGLAAGGLAETLGSIPKKEKGDSGTSAASAADPSGVRAGAAGINKMGELASGQMEGIRSSIQPKPFEVPGVDALDVTRKRPKYEAGGKAMKTPGAFSHKANPIDVIKDGKKIAEMTGGEYIFNPKQSEKLRNLSGDGNSALHKFVRDLLSKRQFK
jgi:hypothetical protein